MGLDLAVQGMKTDYLANHGNLSGKFQNLLQDTFQTYQDKYMDLLEQMLKEKATHFNTPMKNSINRQEVCRIDRGVSPSGGATLPLPPPPVP